MNLHLKFFVFVLLVSMLFFTKEVSALGLTPGRTTIDFEPGMQQEYEVTILNNEHKNFNVVFYLEGDLKQFVTLRTSEIHFSEHEASQKIAYTLHLPQSIQDPGTHEVRLIASEVLPDLENTSVYTVQVKTEIIHQIHIQVPYPGKYLQSEFFVIEKDDGTHFLVTLLNLGKEDISHAQTTFEIYNPTGEKINETQSIPLSIKRRERRESLTSFTVSQPGSYRIKAILQYDSEQKTFEQNVSLGNFQLKLLDLFVNDFKLGSIAQFNVLVENIGNDLVKDAYSALHLHTPEGVSVADVKSATLTLSSGEKQKMFLYWDTKNVQVGVYEGKIALFYGGNYTEKQIKTSVSQNKIDVEVAGVTGNVVGNTGVKKNANFLLLGIALFIAFILIFTLVKKRKKLLKREKDS